MAGSVVSAAPQQVSSAERIGLKLRRSPYSQLWNLDAIADADCVRLTGSVRTYYMKQVALSAAMEAAADVRIENDVVVV